jgi:hypothetical protein
MLLNVGVNTGNFNETDIPSIEKLNYCIEWYFFVNEYKILEALR